MLLLTTLTRDDLRDVLRSTMCDRGEKAKLPMAPSSVSLCNVGAYRITLMLVSYFLVQLDTYLGICSRFGFGASGFGVGE